MIDPDAIGQLRLDLAHLDDEEDEIDPALDAFERYEERPDGTLVRRWPATTNNAPSWP